MSGFSIVCQCPSQSASPDFTQDIGHGNGSIAAQVSVVSSLVEEAGVAFGPTSWGVSRLPEAAYVFMKESFKLLGSS